MRPGGFPPPGGVGFFAAGKTGVFRRVTVFILWTALL